MTVHGRSAPADPGLNQAQDGATETFEDTDITGATSGVRIATDGDVDERDGASYIDSGNWLDAGATASDYEVQWTYTVGSPDGGDAAGEYHELTADRETRITVTPPSSSSATLTVDIREIADTANEISFTVNLSADAS